MSWDEVRRLAADFQKVQAGSSAKKLSDRNCIEVLLRLRKEKLIDVVYTTDGKELLTKDHLRRQIDNELMGCGGRVPLTALQEAISVEYQHIEDAVSRMLKSDPDEYVLILGQLLSTEYLDKLRLQVADWLNDEGQLSVGQIAKHYDLPFEFVNGQVQTAMADGTICAIVDKGDSQILYTQRHIHRQEDLLLGALTAACTPVPLSRVVADTNIQVGLIFQCFDNLLATGQIQGGLSGGRQIDRAIFMPDIYRKALASFAQDSFNQTGFIETASFRKLGWKESVAPLLGSEAMKTALEFSAVVVSSDLWNSLREQCLESLQSQKWLDVASVLPDQINSSEVVHKLATSIVGGKSKKGSPSPYQVIDDEFLYDDKLIEEILPLLIEDIDAKADQVAPEMARKKAPALAAASNSKPSPKEEEDWDEGETKKRKGKGKKKRGAGDAVGSPEKKGDGSSVDSLEFLSAEGLAELVREKWDESCPEQIAGDIAEKIKPSVDARFRSKVESVFLTSSSVNKAAMKQAQADFGAVFKSLVHNIYMFAAGCEYFPDSIAEQLRGYLLKTLCSDVLNTIVCFHSGVPLDSKLAPKARDDMIGSLPRDTQGTLEELRQTLDKKDNVECFLNAIEDASRTPAIQAPIKPPDKKTRADLLAQYIDKLAAQLAETTEPAESLLLSLLLLFSKTHGQMVHVSGRFVPHLVSVTASKIDNEELVLLIGETKDLVVQKLSSRRFKEDERLNANVENIKSIVSSM